MSVGKVILVVLATVVIFSTGLLTGVVLKKQLTPPPAPTPALPPPPGPRFQQLFSLIEGQLDLSPEQDQRIKTLLRESQERTRTLASGEFRKLREQLQAEMNPAQRQKFAQLIRERQRLMREMNPGAWQGTNSGTNLPAPAKTPGQ